MEQLSRLRIVPMEKQKEPIEEAINYLGQLAKENRNRTMKDLNIREILTLMAKTKGKELVERRKTLTTEQFSSNTERSNTAQRRKSNLHNKIAQHFQHLGPFQRIRSMSAFSWLDVNYQEFKATVFLTTKDGEEYEVMVEPGMTYNLVR